MIVLMVLPLVFGRYSVTLFTPPFLELTRPPVPSEIAAFVLVVVQVQLVKSRSRGVNMSTFIDRINRDAGICFVLMTSYTFMTVVMHFTTRVGVFAPVFDAH